MARGTQLSTQTVRTVLHEVNLHSRREAVVPELTRTHRRMRRILVNEHINWNMNIEAIEKDI